MYNQLAEIMIHMIDFNKK